MRLVVDACGVRRGSAATVVEQLLRAWREVAPEDAVTVLVDAPLAFAPPAGVVVRRLRGGAFGPLGRLWARSVGVRRACRRLRADGLLSAVTATSLCGARCPHAVIVHDLRHEVRPEQFSRARQLIRHVAYGWAFRRADVLLCNSERTRGDLIRPRPRLADKAVVMSLGADHAREWVSAGRVSDAAPHALAFGHFANKNVAGVLAAWQLCASRQPELRLHICGLDADSRAQAQRRADALGIAARVDLLPWLDDEQFHAEFASAAVVLFPSEFEGFGLPAVEAMLLSRPLVVSADPALLEVTAGHAVVAADGTPAALADAVAAALARTDEQLSAAAAHAAAFTWSRVAVLIRARFDLGPAQRAGRILRPKPQAR